MRLDGGFVAGLANEPLDVALRLGDGFFDPRGMNPSIGDQSAERQSPDLATYWVEAGDSHDIRGVVDDQVATERRLESADVASLAADDPALHLVRRNLHDRHGRFGS